jgi:hypothetical protein
MQPRSAIVPDMPHWVDGLLSLLIVLVPYALWTLYCLFAINWKKMWPTLAEGAWVPVLLLIVLIALVWSQIRASDMTLFGVIHVGNFWWQLGALLLLTGLGLFAGWVQDRYDWAPFDYAVEPAEHGHPHDHVHAHGHASGDEHAAPHGHDDHGGHAHNGAAHH